MSQESYDEVKMVKAGLITHDANVDMVHYDKDGNAKPIFQENWLTDKLMKWGILSPLWINKSWSFLVQPFLGNWQYVKHHANLIVNAGIAGMASRTNGSGGAAAFTSIGQGTGVTAANATDTTLQTGVNASGTGDGGVHVLPTASVTASLTTTTITNDTAQLVGTVSELATIAITESGVFNADSAGTMLCRQVFTAVNVVSGDTLQFTWKIKSSP